MWNSKISVGHVTKGKKKQVKLILIYFYLTRCINMLLCQHIINIRISNEMVYIFFFFLSQVLLESDVSLRVPAQLSLEQSCFKCSVTTCGRWLLCSDRQGLGQS